VASAEVVGTSRPAVAEATEGQGSER